MSAKESYLAALGRFDQSDGARFAGLARMYARAVIQRVCLAGEEAGLLSDDQRAHIDTVAAQLGSSGWSAELGRANLLARRGSPSVPLATAQMVLALVPAGLTGRFEFQLVYPDRLALGPRWFPCSDHTIIEAGPEGCVVETGLERWELPTDLVPRHAGDTFRAAARSNIVYVWGMAVDPAVLDPRDLAVPPTLAEACYNDLDTALAHVRAAGKDCFSWVERSTRLLTLTASERGDRLSSRSTSLRPGNIAMAAPGNPLHLAELLVHEASHQHFHLGALLGRYVRPDVADERIYSALNGRYRPLERVALAFHAIGNIYLFLDRLVREPRDAAADQAAAALDRMIELGPTAHSLIEQMETHGSGLTLEGRLIVGDLLDVTRSLLSAHRIPAVLEDDRVVVGVGM